MLDEETVIACVGVEKSYSERIWSKSILGRARDIFSPSWSHHDALENISFTLKRGERLAILGRNGAGKSSLIKILVGLQCASSGSVSVLGFDPKRRQKKFYQRISVVFGHKTSLWWDLPVIDSFLAAKHMYEIDRSLYEERSGQLIRALRLERVLTKPVRELSLGERVKCEIATNLIHNPDVLFLDEPTIGLDMEAKGELRKLLVEWSEQTNMSLVLTSHDMSDINECCDFVMLLAHGKGQFIGQIEQFYGLLNVSGKNITETEEAVVRHFQSLGSAQ